MPGEWILRCSIEAENCLAIRITIAMPGRMAFPSLYSSAIDPRQLFDWTGVQTMQINTLFQLYSMVRSADPRLKAAETLLMIPDLFHYFLCGERVVEHTEATTTQMYSPTHGWARDVLDTLEIPTRILPDVVHPGTRLRPVRDEVLRNIGFSSSFPVVAVASHDTASAVAAIPGMDEKSAFISSGTWSLMGVELREPITSDPAYSLGFTNEGGADGSILLIKNLTGPLVAAGMSAAMESRGTPLHLGRHFGDGGNCASICVRAGRGRE